MIELVMVRLASFGVKAGEEDQGLLRFLRRKVEGGVLDYCNLQSIPDTLRGAVADMICAEYLLEKKATVGLAGIDLSAPVKQISEGDTSVAFAYGSGAKTPEQRFDALIDHLTREGKARLVSHRKIRW